MEENLKTGIEKPVVETVKKQEKKKKVAAKKENKKKTVKKKVDEYIATDGSSHIIKQVEFDGFEAVNFLIQVGKTIDSTLTKVKTIKAAKEAYIEAEKEKIEQKITLNIIKTVGGKIKADALKAFKEDSKDCKVLALAFYYFKDVLRMDIPEDIKELSTFIAETIEGVFKIEGFKVKKGDLEILSKYALIKA